ncbi:MAG TPA: glycosyltransferase [Candidatus Paceibacterota bacterium]|nr:glycosyltransferase [Candidatus Paceibacterota bacterium]
MLELIEIPQTELSSAHIDAYADITPERVEKIKALGRDLSGLSVFHVNATRHGGGVAEMLKDQVPLERAAGLDSHWLVIEGDPDFFKITKKIHNLLQGKEASLTEHEKETYLSGNAELAEALGRRLAGLPRGIVVIHDPQPLAAITGLPSSIRTISRLHIDLTSPNAEVIDFLRPYISRYSNLIVSSQAYEKSLLWDGHPPIEVIMPAINPLSDKNKPLPMDQAKKILTEFGINPDQPLVSQVSRFDPWKDPVGVVDSYYKARNDIPELQLAMAGIKEADDDPQQTEMFEKTRDHAAGDRDVFLFFDPQNLNGVAQETFINALQTGSDVILQKSIREGFGLTVTEAMWKGKAVVAGVTAGTMMQIKNAENGFLVSSVDEAAKTLVYLLKNPPERTKIGAKARESVRENFLMPRLIEEHLELYRKLIS